MQKEENTVENTNWKRYSLLRNPDIPLSQVAHNLGINANMLARWCKQFDEPDTTAFPGQGNARDQELSKLKSELQQVKKELDFLKEAAAYFARESQ